jgi:hypothetical protein
VKFDDIRNTDHSEPKRSKLDTAGNPNVAARFVSYFMYALMHEAALGSKNILGPHLLNMDERASTRTK